MRSKGSTRMAVALAAFLALPFLTAAAAGDDPLLERQYHLQRVRAPAAWDVARGRDQIVAVLDTGVDLDHPDLRGRLVPGIDLVDRGTSTQDENGHGTFVAGIIAANLDNNRGGSGVAPRAKVMPVRVLDEDGRGTSDVVAEGIRWATRAGATVINLSLADVPGQSRPPTALITTDVELAIRQAALDGVVVVCAAGNGGSDSTPYAEDLPALVVGATDKRDQVWEHSNYDDRTVFAPGVRIVSTYLGTPYAAADGTSFAAPIVSAGAALLRQTGVDPDRTRERLADTARPIDAGEGRVDVAAALGVARRVRTKPSPRPTPPDEASEKPQQSQPISQPRPVKAKPKPKPKPRPKPGPQGQTVVPPAVTPPPVAPSPQAQASPKPNKVATAQRPRGQVRKPKPPRARKPQAAVRRTEGPIAAPEQPAGSSRPVWPIAVAGTLLAIVGIALAGWFTARRST